jgi:hypothetical protein
MSIQSFFANPSYNALFWGFLGGVGLVFTSEFTTNGYLTIVPFSLVLCAAILATKYSKKAGSNFIELFQSGFWAFVITALCQYTYVLIFVNPDSDITLTGHAWRLAAIAGMAIIGSAFISFLAKPVRA